MRKNRRKHAGIWMAWLLVMAIVLSPGSAYAVGGAGVSENDIRAEEENWPDGPEIVGQSAFLLEANSGMVLYTKNENETRYPASITKIVTSLVVLEHCDNLQEDVTFSHAAVTDIEDGGHHWDYKEGEILTVEQCLYAFLLESVNECGYALAEHVAGSVSAFADMMNEKAAEVGCTNTHFNNPHGLNDESHTTTAHDMGLLFWAALQNEDFYRIDSATSYTIPAAEGRTAGHQLTMHHKMMLSGSEYYYDGVKAGKTGYTSVAKNTLLTYAERDGMQLVCVVMKSDGGGVIYNDTKKLLDYGFDNFRMKDLTAVSQNFCNGLNAGYPMPLIVDGSSAIALPKDISEVTMKFVAADNSDAEGTVGRVQFCSGGTVLTSQPVRLMRAEEASLTAPVVSESELAASEAASASDFDSAVTSESETAAVSDSESQPETTAGRMTVTTDAKNSGHGILFWILIVLVVLLVLVATYWFIIQAVKRHRRKMRRRRRQQRARERSGRDYR